MNLNLTLNKNEKVKQHIRKKIQRFTNLMS